MLWIFCFFVSVLSAQETWAWGKRGHAVINEAAAYLLKDTAPFLFSHSFELSYFSNVPDMLWKRPAHNALERNEHFIDLENFEMIRPKDWLEPWAPQRKEFFKRYSISKKSGRAPWRIMELEKELETLSQQLKTKGLVKRKRFELQAQWLSVAGVLGHYVGDLAQPLHTTTNYDGKKTKQKGIHSFYETSLVNALYPDLASEVIMKAKKLKMESQASAFQLSLQLARDSFVEKDALLKIDKENSRSIKKVLKLYRPLIVRDLARGAVVLAEIWKRHLDWKFEERGFFNFLENPQYIKAK